MLPKDFENRSKEQWQEFELYRMQAINPQVWSEEETRQQFIEIVREKLLVYWIKFTGEETDFSELREKYILWDGTKKNPDMQERLGNKERLQEIINDKIQNYNTLDWFMNFVLQYE